MGVIDIASSKSVWRGMEYYKQNKKGDNELGIKYHLPKRK